MSQEAMKQLSRAALLSLAVLARACVGGPITGRGGGVLKRQELKQRVLDSMETQMFFWAVKQKNNEPKN